MPIKDISREGACAERKKKEITVTTVRPNKHIIASPSLGLMDLPDYIGVSHTIHQVVSHIGMFYAPPSYL